jgi:heat shock protein HtpX
MLQAFALKAHIQQNTFKSLVLLAGFPVLLLLLLYAYFFMMTPPEYAPSSYALMQTLQNAPLAFVGALVWFAIAWVGHAAMIRFATGAKPLAPEDAPEIHAMMANLCAKRNMPVPMLCIVDQPMLNAFASGISTKTYSVTLTRGIIERLDRDELEAVIGHELTHIANRDVRLLIISVIFVGIISFAAQMMARRLLWGRGHYHDGQSQHRGAAMLIGFGLMGVAYVFALLIRFALSRRREYLADAGSVELTGNPQAMMSALAKISGRAQVPDMPSEVAQMCIENRPLGFAGVFATHPPIEERIAVLERMMQTANA